MAHNQVAKEDLIDRIDKFHDHVIAKVPEIAGYLEKEASKEVLYWKALTDNHLRRQSALERDLKEVKRGLKDIEEVLKLQLKLSDAQELALSCNPVEIIERAIEINQLEIDKHEIRITKSYQSDENMVSVGTKVLQILVNVLLNACQALGEVEGRDREIKIQISRIEERLVIAIIDNGPGMNSEIFEKIFTFGFTTKENGSGFGLHISSLLARELGGSLEVSSDGLGSGTEFRLILPIDYVQPSFHAASEWA